METSIVIRTSRSEDERELLRVASLDSARALSPEDEILVAEMAGDLVAALDLADGRVIADPFRPTAPLVDLLRMRAAQLKDTQTRHLPRPAAARRASAYA